MDYLTDAQKKEFRPVPIEMEKGYGTFHHPLMVHGSYENKSERSRRAFVLNVFADGTRSNTEHELLAGVPIFQPGETLTGQFFPLLLERDAMDQKS